MKSKFSINVCCHSRNGNFMAFGQTTTAPPKRWSSTLTVPIASSNIQSTKRSWLILYRARHRWERTTHVRRSADGTHLVFNMTGLPGDVTNYYAYAVDPNGSATLLGPITFNGGVGTATLTRRLINLWSCSRQIKV